MRKEVNFGNSIIEIVRKSKREEREIMWTKRGEIRKSKREEREIMWTKRGEIKHNFHNTIVEISAAQFLCPCSTT